MLVGPSATLLFIRDNAKGGRVSAGQRIIWYELKNLSRLFTFPNNIGHMTQTFLQICNNANELSSNLTFRTKLSYHLVSLSCSALFPFLRTTCFGICCVIRSYNQTHVNNQSSSSCGLCSNFYFNLYVIRDTRSSTCYIFRENIINPC